MIYATVNEFHKTFPSVENDDSEIDDSLLAASLKVDELTFGRIGGAGFESLAPFQRENIKQATLRQAKYILENGYDGENSASSYSVGSISVTANKPVTKAQKLCVDSVSLALLERTGLTGRLL